MKSDIEKTELFFELPQGGANEIDDLALETLAIIKTTVSNIKKTK